MFNVNKKLWSFNFGCLIAGSLVWLVHIGNLAPVPSVLHPHTDFILDYYPGSVTALSAIITNLIFYDINLAHWSVYACFNYVCCCADINCFNF